MPKVTLAHQPSLTREALADLIGRHFDGRCEAYPTRLLGTDVVVKQSAWTGAAVKIKQSKGETRVVVGSLAPSAFARVLIVLFVPWLVLYFTTWRSLRNEVCAFLRSAPELNGGTTVAEATSQPVPSKAQDRPTSARKGTTTMAAAMVGASILVPPIAGLVSGFGIDLFHFSSLTGLVDALMIAAAVFATTPLIADRIEPAAARGAAIGAAAYVFGRIGSDLVLAIIGEYGFGGWIVTHWFGVFGFVSIALAAGVGAGVAAYRPKERDPMALAAR